MSGAVACSPASLPWHDHLVRRDLSAGAANQLWLADITQRRTLGGKVYLCAIKDVLSNRIVGYQIELRMKSSLAVHALNNGVARRADVADCALPTDRGSRFRSTKLVYALARTPWLGPWDV